MTWRDEAACRREEGEEGPDFHSEDPTEIATALSICAECPVRKECLSYALNGYERFGVWGGRTETELRRSLAIDQRGAPVERKSKIHCPYCGESDNILELPPLNTRRQLHCQSCDLIWKPKKVLKIIKGEL